MTGRLPNDLVAEAKSTLDSVGEIKLPPRMWPYVWQRLAGVDAAVGAGDRAALRAALDDLHRMGVDVRPYPTDSRSSGAPAQPPPIGWFPPPPSAPRPGGPGHFGHGPAQAGMAHRSGAPRSRRIAAVAGGAIGLLLAGAVISTFAMNSIGSQSGQPTHPPAITAAPTPTSTSPSSGPSTPTPGGPEYGAWIFAAGLFALAGFVLVAVVVVLRRRSRSSPVPTHVRGTAHLQTGPPETLPAPKEVVEFANRTVMRLVEYGGTS